MIKQKKIVGALVVAGVMLPMSAWATNGMNMEGYGPVATGMGGASMAYDNGTAAMMNNPATLALMPEGNRLDVALGYLGPDVTAKTSYMGMGLSAGSQSDAFYMPAMGWARKTGALTYGVGVFAQGGMGTQYAGDTFMSAGSGKQTRSEVGVGRLLVPLAYQVNDKFSLGGSLDFVWGGMDLQMAMSGQQMQGMMMPGNPYGSMSGSMLMGMAQMPAMPQWGYFDFNNSSDYVGKANSTGWAGKLGFTYQIQPGLTIGGVYHTETSLSDMEGDAQLVFGMGGGMQVPVNGRIKVQDFQWPETFGLGLSWQANEKLMIAADYKRINWSNVMQAMKMSFTANGTQPNQMAQGFANTNLNASLTQNWDDQDVFMIGASYKYDQNWTFRGGVNLANNPIPNSYMNPLFPAIIKNHLSLGAGYMFSNNSDLNFSLTHAFKESATNDMGVTVDHSQTSWQLMYSYRF